MKTLHGCTASVGTAASMHPYADSALIKPERGREDNAYGSQYGINCSRSGARSCTSHPCGPLMGSIGVGFAAADTPYPGRETLLDVREADGH
jgi:hypothetical protein